MKTQYRPEIDGLRTIAVLGVVLFHLKLGLFAGGFVGVDVFFVISGYLITRNILAGAQAGTFSFADFYIRRARRILPALIFTVAATFWAGMLWLPPENLQTLAGEATRAMLSISNIEYWRNSHAYFSHSSDQLALLHCWSLSLEEQFYLFWPIFILWVWRKNKLRVATACVGALSFIVALVWSLSDPQAVFFMMPFRIFEFAIGAAVIFIEPLFLTAAMAGIAGVLGLLAIATAFIFFDGNSAFSLVTLVPSVGAAAVICAGVKYRLSALLTNGPARFIGRISYSLYLCHWPILFFARFLFGEAAESGQGMALCFVLMLVTAILMQRFVESPFRLSDKSSGRAKTFFAFAFLILGSVAINHLTVLSGGWPGRFPPEQNANSDLRRPGSWPCKEIDGARCAFGDLDAPLGVELLGDSHAQQYIAALEPFLQARHMRGEVTNEVGCPVLEGVLLKGERSETCRAARDRELSRIGKNSTPVIIAQYWLYYPDNTLTFDGKAAPDNHNGKSYTLMQKGLERTIQDLGKDGRKLFIIGAQVTPRKECAFGISRRLPALLMPALPFNCDVKPREQVEQEGSVINNMLREVQAKWPDQIRLLIPVDYFCQTECPVVRDGFLLYADDNHFTVAGARYMGERAHQLLSDFLDQKPSVKQQ